MRYRSPFVVALLCSLVPLAAQDDTKPATKKLRLHVIGASVSGGFKDGPMSGAKELGDSVTLQHVLKQWCGEHGRATTHNPLEMVSMFTDPPRIGGEQIQGVQKAKADVVVAIDFPFWFAYGPVAGDEGPARQDKLTEGMALLAKLQMPVLIGDLPDMRGAAVRQLRPSWIPSPEVLKELNEQLAAFVKTHKNFHFVPLAELVRTMKDQGAVLPLPEGPLQTAPGALLQGDRLHATRLGMALLGYTLQEPLRALFPADHALHAQQWTFLQFVEATGAENDLEVVREAAKKVPAGAKGG